MPALRSVLKALLVIALVVVLVAGVGTFTLSRLAFPRTDGEAILENIGLDGPVDVYRDTNGIPHIYAETLHDLFLAQGYVHAQDRFWQMDFQRAVGHGRLSALFGDSQLETDVFLRTLGWATHIAFSGEKAYVAAGHFGVFEADLNGPVLIKDLFL